MAGRHLWPFIIPASRHFHVSRFLSGTDCSLPARGAANVFPKANPSPLQAPCFLPQDHCVLPRPFPSALPSPAIPRAQSRQLRLLRSFWRRKLDPAQLHLQPQPGHTPAPLHSAALLDNIHIFLLESASAAASATKSEEGHTGNAEFPRFGQTKSLLSFTSVGFKKVLPAASHPQAPLFQSAA